MDRLQILDNLNRAQARTIATLQSRLAAAEAERDQYCADLYRAIERSAGWRDRALEAEAQLAAMREALELALEYWAHRQQRYKNRHPAWVQVARAALAGAG